ncbi:MAG: type II toxin-antitoxin system RelE/ParE family toxin [Caulobacter sp.]|nr:type II toxin-antitoxin system RelE/ParE family toxin [Caulobacter sp.]
MSPEAEWDLARLRDFLAEKAPSAAVRAATVIADAVRSLRRLSERGVRLPEDDLRELYVPFGSHGYVVQYVAQPDEVFVLRIFHSLEER